tara:strand:+ start:13738 stop:14091 length:354 start_codon:yes stop_codon:yes gene_type:complete
MGETVQYTALAILGLAVFQGMGIIKEHTIMKLKYEHEKKNGNVKTTGYDTQMAATVNGLHQMMGDMVAGQGQIVQAIQEMGNKMAKSLSEHHEEAEDLHRHVRREIRDLKEVVTQGD